MASDPTKRSPHSIPRRPLEACAPCRLAHGPTSRDQRDDRPYARVRTLCTSRLSCMMYKRVRYRGKYSSRAGGARTPPTPCAPRARAVS